MYKIVSLLASRLLQLSVAYNSLGPQGITNLTMVLPCESLQHLNISSAMNERSNQSAIQSLVEFLEVCE